MIILPGLPPAFCTASDKAGLGGQGTRLCVLLTRVVSTEEGVGSLLHLVCPLYMPCTCTVCLLYIHMHCTCIAHALSPIWRQYCSNQPGGRGLEELTTPIAPLTSSGLTHCKQERGQPTETMQAYMTAMVGYLRTKGQQCYQVPRYVHVRFLPVSNNN